MGFMDETEKWILWQEATGPETNGDANGSGSNGGGGCLLISIVVVLVIYLLVIIWVIS